MLPLFGNFPNCLSNTKGALRWVGAHNKVGRERIQRACHRQLVRNVVDRRRVNSTVGRFSN
jgi:hypothetical protein